VGGDAPGDVHHRRGGWPWGRVALAAVYHHVLDGRAGLAYRRTDLHFFCIYRGLKPGDAHAICRKDPPQRVAETVACSDSFLSSWTPKRLSAECPSGIFVVQTLGLW